VVGMTTVAERLIGAEQQGDALGALLQRRQTGCEIGLLGCRYWFGGAVLDDADAQGLVPEALEIADAALCGRTLPIIAQQCVIIGQTVALQHRQHLMRRMAAVKRKSLRLLDRRGAVEG